MRGAEKIRFRIHPLFALTGILSALTGGLFIFLTATLAAVEHECAHMFAARRYGYSLTKIVLMPYGAVVSGDICGIGRAEELWVLAAGPLANGATALFFVALWWLYPETYPYTDVAAYVSASLFFVNLLPAYPLDGGRALNLLLMRRGERAARAVRIALNAAFSLAAAGYFVYTCFSTPAFTALAFAALLAAGAFGGGKYAPVPFSRERAFSKGAEERRIAISADCTLKKALRFLREDRYLVLVLYDGEGYCGEMTQEEYLGALASGDYSKTLGECCNPTF